MLPGSEFEPGDVNGDGTVNIFDLLALLKVLGGAETDPGYISRAELNDDGSVNIFDLLDLLKIFSSSNASGLASVGKAIAGNYQGLAYSLNETYKITFPDGSTLEFEPGITAAEDFSATAGTASAILGKQARAALPRAFTLSRNAPNPFNPSTTISYSIAEGTASHVSLKVYDLRGRLVTTLVDEVSEAGNYTVNWDGRNKIGRQVASGVYFYRLGAGDFIQTRKMVLLK